MGGKAKRKAGHFASRKYNGKTYWLWRVDDTKAQALKSARGLRLQGWYARVARVPDGWGVYQRK